MANIKFLITFDRVRYSFSVFIAAICNMSHILFETSSDYYIIQNICKKKKEREINF